MKKKKYILLQKPIPKDVILSGKLEELLPIIEKKPISTFRMVLKTILHLGIDLLDLFYPNLCLACDRKLYEHEDVLCDFCKVQLPKTGFHLQEQNPIEKLFYGRCNLYAGAAYYKYIKGGKVQNLIHNFKYRSFTIIGTYVGEVYGRELMKSPRFADVDYIVPIPLHPKKLKKRGYNQSEVFGQGLVESMNAELDADNLYRRKHTASQTKKSRWERYKNVNEIFDLKDPDKYIGKHILLVDDVITTGSTMEACINVINNVKDVKISVAAMASAAH
jgi:ComF family protein